MTAGKKERFFSAAPEEKEELLYPFPIRNFSEEELAYGLWIGMAYTTSSPQEEGYSRMRMRKFEFYSVSHLYQGEGKIELDGKPECILHAGDCIVIPLNMKNRYGSYGDNLFLEDSVKFSGPVADMMFNAGIIKAGIYHIGNTRVLRQIVEFIANPSVKKRLHASLILQNFLMNLYLSYGEQDSVRDLDVLLKMIQDIPGRKWSLEDMAKLCQVSKNQLRRAFLKYTGQTPKLYVDNQKIRSAAELLRSTALSVQKIASQFGWSDPYHFSRRFKQLTGLAPEHYRTANRKP